MTKTITLFALMQQDLTAPVESISSIAPFDISNDLSEGITYFVLDPLNVYLLDAHFAVDSE